MTTASSPPATAATVGGWLAARLRALPGAVGYLVVGGLTGVAALFAAVGLLIVAAASLVGLGVPAIPEALRLIRPLVGFERRRAGARLGVPITVEYEPLSGDLRQRLTTVFRDPANRRDAGWVALHALPGILIAIFAVALPVSVLNQAAIPAYWRLLPAGNPVDNFGFTVTSWPSAWLAAAIAIPLAWVTLQLPAVARGQALFARALLGPPPGARLAVRVAELTATRAAALDAHGAELRRIERDLHDGAQARIAAVIMQLGLADQLRHRDPGAADELVRKAQDTAEAALTELRDVVRDIYPPVLADRGLVSAISALAARSPIPCDLDLDGTGARDGADPERSHARPTVPVRWPAAVEAAAYFVITEALTNATKHSGAQQLRVALGGNAELLTVEVRDDGVGDAVETEGGGLAGIRRRAEALDGRMLLSSPAGGPTVVRVEFPCGS